MIDTTRPVAWSKLSAAEHYLSDYDYVFYIDMDIVIMDQSEFYILLYKVAHWTL